MPPQIVDYKLLKLAVNGDNKYVDLRTDFVKLVNKYLAGGWYLLGDTQYTGAKCYFHCLTQVVVKYDKPPSEPIISAYSISSYGEGAYDFNEKDGVVQRESYERLILSDLRDGWILYGNLQAATHNGSSGTPVYLFTQVLVKYKKPEVDLLGI